MGLLDEAIREHLELKRLRGADPADVARMERDALGPARRPDSSADAVAEAEIGEAPLHADAAQGSNTGGALAPDHAGYEEPLEDPLLEHDVDVPDPYADEPPLEGLRPPPTPSADETSIAPASYGQETAEFDVESAVLDSPPAEPAAPPPVPVQPGAAPGPHAPDLSEHDPVAAPPPSPDEPGPYGDPAAAEHEDAADIDRPGSIEPEAALEDDRTQVHPTGPAAEPVAAEAHHPPPAPARQPPAGEEEPAEDVLEETPDFLQETPEHERLWFEQRPPRDFDFDK
jgi:hypothetical protein